MKKIILAFLFISIAVFFYFNSQKKEETEKIEQKVFLLQNINTENAPQSKITNDFQVFKKFTGKIYQYSYYDINENESTVTLYNVKRLMNNQVLYQAESIKISLTEHQNDFYHFDLSENNVTKNLVLNKYDGIFDDDLSTPIIRNTEIKIYTNKNKLSFLSTLNFKNAYSYTSRYDINLDSNLNILDYNNIGVALEIDAVVNFIKMYRPKYYEQLYLEFSESTEEYAQKIFQCIQNNKNNLMFKFENQINEDEFFQIITSAHFIDKTLKINDFNCI